jgi:hypothetical protein
MSCVCDKRIIVIFLTRDMVWEDADNGGLEVTGASAKESCITCGDVKGDFSTTEDVQAYLRGLAGLGFPIEVE